MKIQIRPEFKAIFAVLVALAGLKVTFIAMARTRGIASSEKFYKTLEKRTKEGFASLSVVMFYRLDSTLKKEDLATYNQMQEIGRTFEQVSLMHQFKDADVQFLQVNLAKGKTEDLKYDFNIATLPTFILFKDGVPLRNAKQAKIQLTGFVGQNELYTFINTHFERDIKNILNAKQTTLAERREQRDYGPRVGFSFGFGGYPYGYGYGYPYYYGRYW